MSKAETTAEATREFFIERIETALDHLGQVLPNLTTEQVHEMYLVFMQLGWGAYTYKEVEETVFNTNKLTIRKKKTQ